MICVSTPGQTRECQLFTGLSRFVSCFNMHTAISALISVTQHTHKTAQYIHCECRALLRGLIKQKTILIVQVRSLLLSPLMGNETEAGKNNGHDDIRYYD